MTNTTNTTIDTTTTATSCDPIKMGNTTLPSLHDCLTAHKGGKSLSTYAGRSALYVAYGVLAEYAKGLLSGGSPDPAPMAVVSERLGALVGHGPIPIPYLIAGMVDITMPKEGNPLGAKLRAPSRLRNLVRDYDPAIAMAVKAMAEPKRPKAPKAPKVPDALRAMSPEERQQWAARRVAALQSQLAAVLAAVEGGEMGITP